jgi:hypothetical protein
LSSTNIALLTAAASLMAAVWTLTAIRWRTLSLLDLYILFVGMYFGVYTFLDAAIDDLQSFDVGTATLSLVLVALMIGMLRTTALLILPSHVRYALQVDNLINALTRVKAADVLALCLVSSLLWAYGYVRYGVITTAADAIAGRWGAGIPYWYLCANQLQYQGLLLACVLAAGYQYLNRCGRLERASWAIILLVTSALLLLSGRRAIINVIILVASMWSILRDKNIFRPRYAVPGVIGLTLVVLFFSNIYQTYRPYIYYKHIDNSPARLSDAVQNFQLTLDDMQSRMADWRFNYILLKALDENIYDHTQPAGTLLRAALLSMVPAAIYPDKVAQDPNVAISATYGLALIDYPKTVFSIGQADFGYLGTVFIPLILCCVFWLIGQGLWMARNRSLAYVVLYGVAASGLFAVEGSYTDLIGIFRNAIIVVVLIECTGFVRSIMAGGPISRRSAGRNAFVL